MRENLYDNKVKIIQDGSHNVATLFWKYYDFNLKLFQLYRTTLYYDFILKTLHLFLLS